MINLSRRTLLFGGAAIVGVTTLMSKPGDESGPRDPYFLDVQAALTKAKIANPTLVIDRERLNANIDTLVGHLPDGMGYRIVAKSLPSLALIEHIRQRAGTDRLMTFNQPMLTALSEAMPEASQLLGKPLPVQAARNYFATLTETSAPAAENVQWLIDSGARLQQYADLAAAEGRTLRFNIELDVGLHRGGFEPGSDLQAALQTIHDDDRLELAGFMGYEPHIPALPTTLAESLNAEIIWQNLQLINFCEFLGGPSNQVSPPLRGAMFKISRCILLIRASQYLFKWQFLAVHHRRFSEP